MEMLMGVPALAKIFLLFTLIVALYRLKTPLWLALLLVSGLSGLWYGATGMRTLRLAGAAAVSGETLFLCAVVVLILGFSNMLSGTGELKRIVAAVSDLLGNSMHSGAALPALIGLLPMPGGAIFSAPMVETACGPDGNQTPEQKTAINHWFRHIWEYWWPFYPGVILASELFKVSIWQLFALHIPLTLTAMAGGYFFILRGAFPREKAQAAPVRGNTARLFRRAVTESASILVGIFSIFGIGPILVAAGATGISARYWPVILGMVVGIVWLAIKRKTSLVQVIKMIFTRNQWSMMMMGVAVMVFKDMLAGVDAFTHIRADLAACHVPPLVVIAALPFISGMVMGLTIGYVGASFPLIISLLPAHVIDTPERFAWLVLAYSFGYVGMLMSPVHLCLILAKEYFKADFIKTYRCMAAPALLLMAAGICLFMLYLRIFR